MSPPPPRARLYADVLYDTEKRDSMFWRLQGDSFEPPEDSEDDDEVLQASDME
jgi:hypothetical protein